MDRQYVSETISNASFGAEETCYQSYKKNGELVRAAPSNSLDFSASKQTVWLQQQDEHQHDVRHHFPK